VKLTCTTKKLLSLVFELKYASRKTSSALVVAASVLRRAFFSAGSIARFNLDRSGSDDDDRSQTRSRPTRRHRLAAGQDDRETWTTCIAMRPKHPEPSASQIAENAARVAERDTVSKETLNALLVKLDAVKEKLTPLHSAMLPHAAVARTFEDLSRAGRRTWQQGKRHVHQPQFESMIAHLESLGLVTPLDAASTLREGKKVVAELGAGKGMFGRLISELTGSPTIAIERRVVKVNYDQPLSKMEGGAIGAVMEEEEEEEEEEELEEKNGGHEAEAEIEEPEKGCTTLRQPGEMNHLEYII